MKKFSEELTHRDYLGALMNLGISRTKTGDIIVQDKQAYLIVSESIADYICENLTRTVIQVLCAGRLTGRSLTISRR